MKLALCKCCVAAGDAENSATASQEDLLCDSCRRHAQEVHITEEHYPEVCCFVIQQKFKNRVNAND